MSKRIFFLADGGSPHTIKWAKSLAQHGYEIFIFGLASFNPDLYRDEPRIKTWSFGADTPVTRSGNGSFQKIRYLSSISKLRKLITQFRPDILHVHFVSSYGLLGSLSGFPLIYMSVWGADVYDFPEKSFIHRLILKFNLKKAKSLFSTSNVMAKQAGKYTEKKINVIPFGIDLKKFGPGKSQLKIWDGENIILGTVKTLENKYGINDLITAFALLKKRLPDLPLKLLIVGKGTKEAELKALAEKLNVIQEIHFTGWIPVENVPEYHKLLDIAVFPSILDSESFGVAAVEASASEKPVIVSRVGGLIEVVDENVTGLVVPAKNPEALSHAMEKLVKDPELRKRLGKAGRERVEKLYNWDQNLSDMLSFYEKD